MKGCHKMMREAVRMGLVEIMPIMETTDQGKTFEELRDSLVDRLLTNLTEARALLKIYHRHGS